MLHNPLGLGVALGDTRSVLTLNPKYGVGGGGKNGVWGHVCLTPARPATWTGGFVLLKSK